jgi:hypothetical protein
MFQIFLDLCEHSPLLHLGWGEPLILVLYVDEFFLVGSEKLIMDCKRDLAAEFEMKDLGLMHYFLGLEVWQRMDRFSLGKGNMLWRS